MSNFNQKQVRLVISFLKNDFRVVIFRDHTTQFNSAKNKYLYEYKSASTL